jgi:hypothetical protein
MSQPFGAGATATQIHAAKHKMITRRRGGTAGSGAFLGLGAYSYFSGMNQLERQRAAIAKSRFGMGSRKAGIIAISAAFAWAGFYRAMK